MSLHILVPAPDVKRVAANFRCSLLHSKDYAHRNHWAVTRDQRRRREQYQLWGNAPGWSLAILTKPDQRQPDGARRVQQGRKEDSPALQCRDPQRSSAASPVGTAEAARDAPFVSLNQSSLWDSSLCYCIIPALKCRATVTVSLRDTPLSADHPITFTHFV